MKTEVIWNKILKTQIDIQSVNENYDPVRYEKLSNNVTGLYKDLKAKYKKISEDSHKLSKEKGIIYELEN